MQLRPWTAARPNGQPGALGQPLVPAVRAAFRANYGDGGGRDRGAAPYRRATPDRLVGLIAQLELRGRAEATVFVAKPALMTG